MNSIVKLCGYAMGACVLAVIATPTRADRITAKSIIPERELFITSSAVVDSYVARYPGSWSFGTLIQEIAGEENASRCIAEWLDTWRKGMIDNDRVVPPRPAIVEKIIAPWQKRDGYDPESEEPWKPKLENAPFRLCAIVNRIDLCAPELADTVKQIAEDWRRRGWEKRFDSLISRVGLTNPLTPLVPQRSFSGYGGPPSDSPGSFSAGQGRFIFGATDAEGNPLAGDWMIIFEYRLPLVSPAKPQDWARDWHSLAELDPNSHDFVLSLEGLTRGFTHRVTAQSKVVGLAQIRTSEAAFHPDREFREYRFSKGSLELSPLALTPDSAFAKKQTREQEALGAFLNGQAPLIRSGLHLLPSSVRDRKGEMRLTSLRAVIPAEEPDFHWDPGANVSRETRRIMSLNTCNGCHAGETGCRDGLHVHARPEWLPSQTSDFLRMDGKPLQVADPGIRSSKVEYREMNDRAAILAALLEPRERKQLDELRDLLRTRLRRSH